MMQDWRTSSITILASIRLRWSCDSASCRRLFCISCSGVTYSSLVRGVLSARSAYTSSQWPDGAVEPRAGSAPDLRLTRASTCTGSRGVGPTCAARREGARSRGQAGRPLGAAGRTGAFRAAFLVLDESEQRRHDDRHARHKDCRQLVAQGLAAACHAR
eukprot:scaffold5041_cov107-Isochrysis_galbana.AAC.4